jgi:hypothetical protein
MPIQKITTGVVDASVFSSPTITSPTISGNTNFDSGTLFVDATNNRVGVGTPNPSRPLDVLGSARLSFSGGDNYVEFESASNYVGRNSAGNVVLNAAGGQNIIQSVAGTTITQATGAGLFQFNSGYGSAATAFGCRAWVNFNGTGTVAIRGSGNVSSVGDNGTGTYTVNFTNAMPDANYEANVTGDSTGARIGSIDNGAAEPTTSALRVGFLRSDGGPGDPAYCMVSVFR